VPTLLEPEAAAKTSNVDVAHQLLGKSAAGDSLHDVPLPGNRLPEVPMSWPDISVGVV
jgi:hypothetical protein